MAMNEYEISLVINAKNGDSMAFEELYSHYYGKIFALARMTVKTEADAEDVLQQTFISAWRNLHNLNNPKFFSTWLQRITLNQCYMLLRKKNIAILIDAERDVDDFLEEEESNDLLPAIYAERDDLRVRLGKIIDDLSEVQKQTIVLYYFNEQKVEEIATIMECSVGTVKTRLRLARNAIRSEVEEEERKSGEKFYGIVGIPLLPFGEMFVQHIQLQITSSNAYSGVLAIVREAISHGATYGVQGLQAAAGTQAATGSTMSAGAAVGATKGSAIASLPVFVKALWAVAILAVCGGLVFFGVQYFGSTPDEEDVYIGNDGEHMQYDDYDRLDDTDEYEYDMYDDEEVDMVAVYETFLQVLRNEGEPVFREVTMPEREIVREGVYNVAIVDLTNDGVPELIFKRLDSQYYADIVIYGFVNNEVVQLFKQESFMSLDAGNVGFAVYSLYEGGFVIQVTASAGGDAWRDYAFHYEMSIEPNITRYFNTLTWNPVANERFTTPQYHINDVNVSLNQYEDEKTLMFTEFQYFLVGQIYRHWEGQPTPFIDPNVIDRSMTYAEAIAYLEGWLANSEEVLNNDSGFNLDEPYDIAELWGRLGDEEWSFHPSAGGVLSHILYFTWNDTIESTPGNHPVIERVILHREGNFYSTWIVESVIPHGEHYYIFNLIGACENTDWREEQWMANFRYASEGIIFLNENRYANHIYRGN